MYDDRVEVTSPGMLYGELTIEQVKEMLLSNPKITQKAMAEKIGVTDRAVKKSIRELNDRGILQRIGSPRNGYWKVMGEDVL